MKFNQILIHRMRGEDGQSLIELLIVFALMAVLLPSLSRALIASREGKVQHNKRIQAAQYLQESETALRTIREAGWSNISTNGVYHPFMTSSTWSLVSGTETFSGGFVRSVTISGVNRNTTGAIVSSGGALDPSTKKIVTTVSWSSPIASSINSTSYMTRHLANASLIQTTQTDFDAGNKSNVATTNTAGGEVTLLPNTKGKWCDPHLSSVTIDLPGIPKTVSAIEGHVFASTGVNANASETSFAHVLVANTDPPSFTLHGIGKGYQTHAVFGDANYGYIATTNNTKEVVIFNLNSYSDVPNKIYAEVGSFNTTTNTNGADSTDADTLFVLGTKGYVTAGNYLYVFDLTSKTGSRSRIGNRIQFANAGDTAGEIYGRVVGTKTYIYVAIIGSTPEELKIIDVTSSPSQWGVVGSINIEPNNCSALESGQAVYINPSGDRAYLSSVNDTTFKEFFIINTSTKTAPSLIGGFATNPPCTNGGGYEAGGMNPEQSVVPEGQSSRAILVGTDSASDSVNSEEYQVLDLSSESAPVRCGGLQFDQGIFGVAGVKESDGDAYAYIITGDTAHELKVIQGGPDGNYVDSGTYESSIFNPGYPVTFNSVSSTVTTPSNTSLQYQVAAADPVSGSCNSATYTYVGPDGTSGTYFNSGSNSIPLDDNASGYENPAQCFRYKASFSSTNYNSTPILNDITVNYSP